MEWLRPRHQLRNLSCTCKYVRSLSLPILFRACWVDSSNITRDHFTPRHLWPHVQHLFFHGEWYDIVREGDPRYRMNPPPLPRFSEVLSQFPNLSRITIRECLGFGVTEFALATLLSYPALKELHVIDETLDHAEIYKDDVGPPTFPVPPLRVLRQHLSDYRTHPRAKRGDLRVFAYLAGLPVVQGSLEVLELPSEVAPYTELASAQWPRLRRLELTGELPAGTPPLVGVFGCMPALEILSLKIACGHSTGRTVFCAPGWSRPFPWPNLQRLTVSNVNPDDPFYSRLPAGLRHLSIRCWPRRYLFLLPHELGTMINLRWFESILKSSSMCQLLSRCGNLPGLEELELEVEEDDPECDNELFCLTPHLFPNLSSITVIRYRKWGNPIVPMERIGTALTPLSRLQTLYIYPDFKNMPHSFGDWTEDIENTERDAAAVLAQRLSHSVRAICIMRRRGKNNRWRQYYVTRTAGDDAAPMLHCDQRPEYGLREYDEPGFSGSSRLGFPVTDTIDSDR
ncbi:hypothetical protein C8Q77DRAFT_1136465 [Trametes polyzona]|nr:hypothetical protein C8Q77DRAFT_1136465 [Trametes polyzona]